MGAALLQLPSLNFEPLYYRPHGAGHWSGHVPFAYDLVAALRPSKIVELGTEYGESYFTFCQAVVECGIACQSFAVDTWRGDPHTGAYGESVFDEVSTHNQKHYLSFSTLMRASFDDALPHFPDESINLLHIDGLHTYEAVLHDFQAWFPKVKPGGIILIHDTQVRQSDFGVWRLWEELRGRYEGFEFPHSCGLGVLQKPGGGAQSGITNLLFQGGERAGLLRRFYLLAGERLQFRDLSERQRRKGQWELLAKLFWRAAGQVFSEERSVFTRDEVSAVPREIRLELPPHTSLEELRIDLLESPAFMRLHALRLFDVKGDLILSVPSKDLRENLFCAGLQFIPDDSGSNIAARLPGEPPAILWNIPEAPMNRLAEGGSLRLEISGLESEEYASIIGPLLEQYQSRALAAESSLVSWHEGIALGWKIS